MVTLPSRIVPALFNVHSHLLTLNKGTQGSCPRVYTATPGVGEIPAACRHLIHQSSSCLGRFTQGPPNAFHCLLQGQRAPRAPPAPRLDSTSAVRQSLPVLWLSRNWGAALLTAVAAGQIGRAVRTMCLSPHAGGYARAPRASDSTTQNPHSRRRDTISIPAARKGVADEVAAYWVRGS